MPAGFNLLATPASKRDSKIPTMRALKVKSPLRRRSATSESPGLRSLVLVEKYHGSQPSSPQSTPNAKALPTPKVKPRPAPGRDTPSAKEPPKKPIFKVTAIRDTERVSSPRPVPKKPKTVGKENSERRHGAQTHVSHTTTPTSVPRPFKISIPRSFSSNTRIPVRKHAKRESIMRIRSRPSLRLTPSRTRTSLSTHSALSSPSPRTPVSPFTYTDTVVIQSNDDTELLSSSASMNQLSTKSESEWIDEEEVVDKKPVEEASPMKVPPTPEAKPSHTPDATTPMTSEAKSRNTPESKVKVSPSGKQHSPSPKHASLPRVFVVGRLSTSSPVARRRRPIIPPLLDSQAGSANAQIRMELSALRARKKVQAGVTELSDKKI
ncbi:hypothetical protein EDD18DRAFT_38264 [Armillaria luteobubalina]|uniref:Uncharacterized protein n=1 Tax=Armillaria luteobubalina TaxID=153913 RepID=A0AA39QQK5_9AGAR|nr:hypothetical protein EDD18DRAFT_38264 [Armillaria luteobubalina]